LGVKSRICVKIIRESPGIDIEEESGRSGVVVLTESKDGEEVVTEPKGEGEVTEKER